MNITLRPYQRNCIIGIRDAFKSGARGVLLTAPTGSGKTIMFCAIAESARKRQKNILILVHRQELLRQCSDALNSIGVDHGLIAPGKTRTLDHVQVASVQTLIRRLGNIPTPDLIIQDEAHHAVSGSSFGKILSYYPRSMILGVTATPLRHDGKPLGRISGGFFDTLVEGPTIPDLVSQGFLSPPVVYAPPSSLDMTGVHTRFGEYDQKETEDRIDKPVITGNAVEHYLRICPGVPSIVFCVSVKHAENVAAEFRAAGIAADSIDGKLDDRTRVHRISALGNGGISVLTSCEIISEGTDIPVVTAAILLRPTKSLGLFMQQVGRCLRPFPGKRNSIILDHVGNVHLHGMVDEIREWSLDGDNNGKPKKKGEIGENYRQCLTCYAMFPAYRQTCPQCGAEWQPKLREIQMVDGVLVKINPLAEAQDWHFEEVKREHERRQKIIDTHAAKTLPELISVAKKRGYKIAWAYRVWGMRQSQRRA